MTQTQCPGECSRTSITYSLGPQTPFWVPHRGFALSILAGYRSCPPRCDSALLQEVGRGRGRLCRRSRGPEGCRAGGWAEAQQLMPRCISLCFSGGG